ncbi:hypothetical protein PR202_gb02152 [Eleusine coracana subsp. coracana]|uniref:NIF system FeS cluster assembly NifU N-terminal domain-containing protein n=1 Tax=Eleusine coracana subsp. coracana TaxID=191504 RepID=A0AAV5DY78_ELECO|nr:hypothetical protein PR202_gb02152 [Eleusine coracana subsp. coracana]
MMLRAAGKRLIAAAAGGHQASPAAAATMAARRGYHERVVDHYNNPRNVGTMDKDDPKRGHGARRRAGVRGRHEAADPRRRGVRKDRRRALQNLRLRLRHRLILSSEWVKGKQMEEVVAIKNSDIAKHLSLPPVKLHCSMLAEDAIKAAVKDYEAKKAKLAKADE